MTLLATWGRRGDGEGEFSAPADIAVDSATNVYVVDTGNHRVQRFGGCGEPLGEWGSRGTGNDQLLSPQAIAVDEAGAVYVADTRNHRIQKFSVDGAFMTQWGAAGSSEGRLSNPSGIAVDNAGNIYVADTGNFQVQKFTPEGDFIRKWGRAGTGDGQFRSPRSIAVEDAGNVYVLDFFLDVPVQRFSGDGDFLDRWGATGTDSGQLRNPNGIAIDRDGNVYIADTENHRVQKFSATGQLLGWFGAEGHGDGQFSRPLGLALDAFGNLYVADSGNHRVQVFGPRSGDGTQAACIPAPIPTPTPLPPGATPEADAPPETVVLTDIDFFLTQNAVLGWVVGEDGLILHTGDGGETWSLQESPTGEDLRGVDFTDETTGWIVGGNGTILKTTDGGTTWEEQTGGGTRQFLGVSGLDERLAWAVNGKEVLHTTDGGATWEVRHVFFVESFQDIHVNAGSVTDGRPTGVVGWAIGAEGVWKSRFYGGEWVVVRSAMAAPGVNFLDFSTGWAVDARCVLWKTTNGGSVWEAEESNLYVTSLVEGEEGFTVVATADSLLQECTQGRVSFISEDRGWAAFASGVIARTFDGGKTWTTQWPVSEESEASP